MSLITKNTPKEDTIKFIKLFMNYIANGKADKALIKTLSEYIDCTHSCMLHGADSLMSIPSKLYDGVMWLLEDDELSNIIKTYSGDEKSVIDISTRVHHVIEHRWIKDMMKSYNSLSHEDKTNVAKAICRNPIAREIATNGAVNNKDFVLAYHLSSDTANIAEEQMYYIRTRDYLGNAIVWWGKNRNGYTADIEAAGKYSEEEAKGIINGAKSHDLRAYRCEDIDNNIESKKLIIDAQYVNEEDVAIKVEK